MKSSASLPFAVPLAAALIFPLGDFIVKAYGWGSDWASYATVVRPLAFFVGFSLLLAALGSLAGLALAPLAAAPRRLAVVGCGSAGALTAALVIRTYVPFAAFDTPLRQIVLWSAAWAVAAWVLTLAAIGLSARERLFAAVERALMVVPFLLAAVVLYQLSGVASAAIHWAVPAASLVLASLVAFRPREAAYANALLALGIVASPWVGPAEPVLAVETKVIGLSADAHDPAHVILISIDTLRADEIGFNGGPVPTPHLDRLAADSVVFDHAFSTSAWTLPALTSLHLGVSPWVHGVWSEFDRPPSEIPSLAQRFSEAGYLTGKIAANPFVTEGMTGPALSQGFLTVAEYPIAVHPRTNAFEFLDAHHWFDLMDDAKTDDLVAWASDWVKQNKEEPFFLWLHIYDPHGPYQPPAEFAPAGVPADDPESPITNPDIRPKSPDEAEQMHSLYRGEIAYVDDRVGQFLRTLEDLGLYDDALIAFVSDHGEEFFDHEGFGHGHTMYQELLHVPLAFKLPHASKTGRVGQPVSTLSFAPTLLNLAGIAFDPEDFSTSAISLDGQNAAGPFFAAGSFRKEPLLAVVFDGLKLVKRRGFDSLRLYDLEADPQERTNLATRRPDDVRRGLELLQHHRERAQALRDRLGVRNGPPLQYGAAEKQLLRSLGYVL